MPKQTNNGNCFMCGKTTSKLAMKNHLLKEHNSGDEDCYLIKAEGAYSKDYWLFFTIAKNGTLTHMDNFLREIWCECCGHMSAFRIGREEIGKSKKISFLEVGDKLQYEYDFGTSTDILITVMSEISRPKKREKVLLLARNEPIPLTCDSCQAPADYADAWQSKLVCKACAGESDSEGLLDVTNSPRMGECGYSGETDRWIFDPKKPFPQLFSGYAKNRPRYVWVFPE